MEVILILSEKKFSAAVGHQLETMILESFSKNNVDFESVTTLKISVSTSVKNSFTMSYLLKKVDSFIYLMTRGEDLKLMTEQLVERLLKNI